ncbi:MAG: RNA polymerase factor sigma-54 [Helicobacteraceae bacterium]|jgi:RNA polymerase sigma-54 factor|nr:RNA polymerase factor sigma-54 [Helicobacteraceae bacterium]
MSGGKLRVTQTSKGGLNETLRGWLPILQKPITELESLLKEKAEENPFLQIEGNQEISYDENDPEDKDDFEDEDFRGFDDNYYRKDENKKSITDTIEATTLQQNSLYDALYEQITDQFFPTPKSKKIALELINFINEEGFFEGDTDEISAKLNENPKEIEKIRLRFERFSPTGIGAKNNEESFMWQLNECEDIDKDDEDLYQLVKTLIYNSDKLQAFRKEDRFAEALLVFKKFRAPPAIDFYENSPQVIPDFFVFNDPVTGKLEIELNDPYYPTLTIDTNGLDKKEDFVKNKIKEARDLIDAVEMRRKTLMNIGLMIIDRQYDFFKNNGAIAPMKLADISADLERNSSTISRAISNKYLVCDRGRFELKSFFSIAIDDNNETSTRAIKDYLQKLIKEEPKEKPLSDQKLLQIIQKQFGNINMVRRTITKYREQLSIPTSGERKRIYLITR